ncbi:hypothetical protein INS49_013523 [Diaporthe citri]|uniref:uncharacterized protein n=1 Tax=Diaporthe citri TaxID=83186 RepID=UPI001C7E2EB1|nr:uncharacterized protein INS49_013523 [Diaporthe citri]KAG6357646.1 hypothetical protein INS49_013523 [Diaporthe citri]
MASNDVGCLDGVLGFDMGSTETRVVLAWDDGANVQKRVIENRDDTHTLLNATAQFSTRVLVHDDEPVKYLGNANQVNREESSAKFIPYILVGKNEKLREQYLILERLWDERKKVRKSDFHTRLEEAFNQFLCFVLKRTKSALQTYSSDGKQIQIKTVALTIPSQWDINFEELYRRLFTRAFLQIFDDTPQAAARDMSVVFHTEATALAQYIFHEASHTGALGGGMPRIGTILGRPNAQCLIDCGGHNANSTLTQFHPNKDGHGVLYELAKPQGAGGGSEMWIHDLLNQLIEQYRIENKDQAELPQGFYQDLKRKITTSLGTLMQEAFEFITCKHPRGLNQPVCLRIDEEMCEKAFQTGFKHVKAMIESQLQGLATIKQGWATKDHVVTVIVSGGSSLHPGFINWIKELCMKLNLPAPLFTKAMEIHYAPARIALGAAYASLASDSVTSFAEKCAFGLQKGNVINQGENDEHLDLEGFANTIWYKERGAVPVTVVATGDQAEYRIVCEPFLESYRGVLPTDRSMARGSSYDFLNIGTLPDGYKHRIEFKLNDKEEQVELKIYRIPKPLCSKLESYARQTARKDKSTDEIDSQIATAMEDYHDDSDYDDTDLDETYRDDSEGDDSYRDDTEGVDNYGDDADGAIDYPDDVDNEDMPSSARPGPSSGLGISRHDPGPSSDINDSHRRDYTSGEDDEAEDDDKDDGQLTSEKRPKNRSVGQRLRAAKHLAKIKVKEARIAHRMAVAAVNKDRRQKQGHGQPSEARKQLQQTQGKLERAKRKLEQVPDRFGASLLHADVDHQAAASNNAGIANKASATNAFTSTSSNSSSARGAIASKADTARATGNAFRGSRDVSGSAASYSQTGFGVPGGTLTTAFGARPGPPTGPPRNNTVSSSGAASSSRYMRSSSMDPGYQGSASATWKRPASPEDDDRRPKKRTHTSGGTLSGAADIRRQNGSRREPGRDRDTISSARQHSAVSDSRRDPLERRDGRDERPSADTGRYPNLQAPSRRAAGAQEFTWSNRYRDQNHEAPVQPMAVLNLGRNASASGTRPLDPMPPPPRRDDNAAPRASPAGNFGSRSRPYDSYRPASGFLSRRTSGPAGNSQQPQGFNDWDRDNRGGHPPRSD